MQAAAACGCTQQKLVTHLARTAALLPPPPSSCFVREVVCDEHGVDPTGTVSFGRGNQGDAAGHRHVPVCAVRSAVKASCLVV